MASPVIHGEHEIWWKQERMPSLFAISEDIVYYLVTWVVQSTRFLPSIARAS